MKISIIRGAFINPYEMQNYYPLERYHDIVAVSSKRPLNSDIDLPLVKLLSPTDMPNIPFKYPILNRLFVDAHYLLGLENVLKGCDIAHVAETYYHYTIQAIMAKKKGQRTKLGLVCTVCNRQNYTTEKNKTNTTTRLELQKFCKRCKKKTLHKEGK